MVEITEREVGRLEQKVDTILENQSRFMDLHEKLDTRLTGKHDHLSSRIGSVENKIHWYTGGMATISAAFVLLGEQIKRALFGH